MSPATQLEQIEEFAKAELGMNWHGVWALHRAIANYRDMQDPAVLAELEEKLKVMAQNKEQVKEEAYEETWSTIEQTAEQEIDIFSQLEVSSFDPETETVSDYKSIDLATDVLGIGAATESRGVVHGGSTPVPDMGVGTVNGDGPGGTNELDRQAVDQGDAAGETGREVQPGLEPAVIKTDAGLIDPETGEIIDPSFIFRKFGWTEFPQLAKDATQEQVKAYEDKLDQVAEEILWRRDKTSRWTAANNARCKPLEDYASFVEEQFAVPMAKALAPHRLPTYKTGKKKGEYSNKTLKLASGQIQFRQSGGAYIHDEKAILKHIEEKGVEQFSAINARAEINYSHTKLLTALNNGSLKEIPGTGINNVNPLAIVKVVSKANKDERLSYNAGEEERA